MKPHDDTSRSLLNIVVIILDGEQQRKPVLMEMIFLDAVNSTTVGQTIITSVVSYGIKFNNVFIIISDNAKYMVKCVREVLLPVFPNLCHGTCWAHMSNFFGSQWVGLF